MRHDPGSTISLFDVCTPLGLVAPVRRAGCGCDAVAAAAAQVCKYIDIPLQHISNMTLLRMNRPPRQHTEDLLNKLRDRIPGNRLPHRPPHRARRAHTKYDSCS